TSPARFTALSLRTEALTFAPTVAYAAMLLFRHPNTCPRALAACRAALVRWLIRPASNSATLAIWVSRNLPVGPSWMVGRSQNTTPAFPISLTTRSSLAITKVASWRRQIFIVFPFLWLIWVHLTYPQ